MNIEDPKENYVTGYVRLYRSVMNKAWFKKGDYFKLWCYLMMKATHRGYDNWFEGKPITLSPGQFITGRQKIANETGIHESSIERMLTHFEKIEQQIEQRKSSTSRLISILNWQEYQSTEQRFEQRLNNERTTVEQPLNTIQEHNNEKNDKNGKNKRSRAKAFVFIPPSVDDVKQYFKANGYLEEVAEKAFQYYSEGQWIDSKGNKVRNWKQKMVAVWFKEENRDPNKMPTQKEKQGKFVM